MTISKNIAYFISPHGFGHAARSTAVMEAMTKQNPLIIFHVFTSVPKWFFVQSSANIFYHYLVSDIGVIQSSPLENDLNETLRELSNFYPVNEVLQKFVKKIVTKTHCQAIICDIAPLGIIIAKSLGLPSILIENFTWDWIYEPYLNFSNEFKPIISYLKDTFKSATFHVQTEPFCQSDLAFDLRVPPVSRNPQNKMDITKNKLAISENKNVVLLTMGGFGNTFNLPEIHNLSDDYVLLIPGNYSKLQICGNIYKLPFKSDFYYPDLINASDVVVGKAGYSTISEVYYAGIPYISIHRNDFREVGVLEEFLQKNMNGFVINYESYIKGNFINQIQDLITNKRIIRNNINGSDLISNFLFKKILN